MIPTICFVGASTVEGQGDELGLGWPGRLRAALSLDGAQPIVYNLGIRGNSSAMIRERWQRECAARLSDPSGLVVLSFGVNDIAEFEDGTSRADIRETLDNVADVVANCAAWRKLLWVGPTAVNESRMPFHSRALSKNLYFRNEKIARLNVEFQSIASRHDVPFLDLFSLLLTDPIWNEDLLQLDGLHPTAKGYDLIANHVAAWPAWCAAVGRDA